MNTNKTLLSLMMLSVMVLLLVSCGPPAESERATNEENAMEESEAEEREVSADSSPQEEITNSIGMKLQLIPAGEFMMGATPGDDQVDDDERPQHRVEITKPFYIGVYEVTQSQWERVMGTTVRQQRDKDNRSWYLYGEGSSYPIYYVSWDEAIGFCEELSRMTGEKYRLPTEADWEYACRAGTETKYYWGNNDEEAENYAWYGDTAATGTHEVGCKQPNAWGLYDMSGNVWEWCNDWYGIYPEEEQKDPKGPQSGVTRLLRGGGWTDTPEALRNSFRGGRIPDGRGVNSGFRPVRCAEGQHL